MAAKQFENDARRSGTVIEWPHNAQPWTAIHSIHNDRKSEWFRVTPLQLAIAWNVSVGGDHERQSSLVVGRQLVVYEPIELLVAQSNDGALLQQSTQRSSHAAHELSRTLLTFDWTRNCHN